MEGSQGDCFLGIKVVPDVHKLDGRIACESDLLQRKTFDLNSPN